MARTAPVPNIPAIPGMNPGVFVMGGGGGGGGGSGRGGKGSGGAQGANGDNAGDAASGGGQNAGSCGPGSGGGCTNPVHGGGGTAAGDPVDPTTGRAYTVAVLDLVLPGPLPVAVERSYSSDALDEDVGLGAGWSHSYAWNIEESRRSLRIWQPHASPTLARKPGEGHDVLLPCGMLRRTSTGYTIDVRGRRLSFRKDGQRHHLVQIADTNGNTIALERRRGMLERIVDSVGREIRVRRDASGRIAAFEVYDATAGAWRSFRTYAYDGCCLVEAVDALGHSERYAYDDAKRLIRRSTPGGLVAELRYDRAGRCVETWCHRPDDDSLDDDVPPLLADGVTRAKGFLHVKLEYADGFTEVVTSRALRHVYGNDQHKSDRAVFDGGVGTYEYDSAGNVSSYDDPKGGRWRVERDAAGRVLAESTPSGAWTTYSHNEHGAVVAVVNPLGQAVRYARDDHGNLLAIDDDLGNLAQFEYDSRGRMVTAVLPNGGVTRMRYDAHGNRVEVVEPDGATRRIQYDFLGRVLSYADERGGITTYAYDACGRTTAITRPSGACTRYDYDPDGNPQRIVEADGRVTQLRWAGYRVVTEIVRPDGAVVRYRYDREQDLVRVINEVGAEHRLVRAGEGRIVAEHTFDGRVIDYRYDIAGQLTRVDRDGASTELSYDVDGRIVARKHDDLEETFEYDPLGRLVRAENGDARCEWVYDARGRVVREHVEPKNGQASWTNEYQRDALGEVVRRTGPGLAVDITRDVVGRPLSLDYGAGAPLTVRYDAAGYETERVLPGGGRVRTTRSADGHVTQIDVLGPARGPEAAEPDWVGAVAPSATLVRTFDRSPQGVLLGVADPMANERREVTRDANGRVVALRGPRATEIYGYDPSGDAYEQANSRRYGPGGRPLARGATVYAYDGNGRVIEKVTDDRRWRFSWRADGMLGQVHSPDGARIAYTYDPRGRRLEARIERSDSVATCRYVWDGEALVGEIRETVRAGAPPIVEERTWLAMPDDFLLLAERVAGEERHIVHAPLDAVEALVAPDGRVAAVLERSLFGRVDDPVAASETPLRGPGQLADAETGLFYNRFRYLDPDTGAFLSPEPLGLEASLKTYAYADNYPLDAVDLNGLMRTTVTRRPPLAPVTGRSGPARPVGEPDHTPTSVAHDTHIHPAVNAALPPTSLVPGRDADQCGEPIAMSRHLYDWESRNQGPPPLRCNPPDPNWQNNLQSALGEVQDVTSQQNAASPAAPTCANCSQTLPRLWALANAPGAPPVTGGRTPPPAGAPLNGAQRPHPTQGAMFTDATGAPINPGVFP